MKKFMAFTLAEVLITLGIIGVVATMTISTVISKIDDRANMSALRKFYTEFSSATKGIVNAHDIPETWGLANNDEAACLRVMEYYKKYFSVLKVCAIPDTSCFPLPVYFSNGKVHITESNYKSWFVQGFVLKNGTTVFLDINKNWYSVFVDVNGFKKPNKLGTDVFVFAVNSEGNVVSMADPSLDKTAGGSSLADYNWAFVYMENGWQKP